MISAICMIVVFQLYWVNRLFSEEKERLQKQTDVLFKELVYKLQLNRFKADTLIYNTGKGNNLFALEAVNSFLKDRDSIKLLKQEKIILINHLNYKLNEIKYIKIKNNKIPDDSVFIILKQKYNEDSINNIK